MSSLPFSSKLTLQVAQLSVEPLAVCGVGGSGCCAFCMAGASAASENAAKHGERPSL
jgi:hypothetical protein